MSWDIDLSNVCRLNVVVDVIQEVIPAHGLCVSRVVIRDIGNGTCGNCRAYRLDACTPLCRECDDVIRLPVKERIKKEIAIGRNRAPCRECGRMISAAREVCMDCGELSRIRAWVPFPWNEPEGSEKSFPDHEYLSASDMARTLCVSTRTISKLMRSGDIKCIRIGKKFRVARKEFKAWIERNTVRGCDDRKER